MREFELVQFNIARMRAPLTDPLMAEFVAQIESINALAEQSLGFVWRLKSGGGDATAVRIYGDEPILVNMSIWETVEHLRDYVYRSAHTAVMKDRKLWFEKIEIAYYALWWIPMDDRPTPQQGKERLEHLRQHGDSSHAFTFRQPFPKPVTSL